MHELRGTRHRDAREGRYGDDRIRRRSQLTDALIIWTRPLQAYALPLSHKKAHQLATSPMDWWCWFWRTTDSLLRYTTSVSPRHACARHPAADSLRQNLGWPCDARTLFTLLESHPILIRPLSQRRSERWYESDLHRPVRVSTLTIDHILITIGPTQPSCA